MALDPRFSSLIQALSGIVKQYGTEVPQAGANAQGATQGVTPQTQAAAENPQTQAVLAGANAPSPAAQRAANAEGLLNAAQTGQTQTTQGQQPQGYGGGAVQAQQAGTALGGQTPVQGQQAVPANLTPEQAAQAQQQAQTQAEVGLWDTIMQNLSGMDNQGNLLQGEALSDFKKGHAMGGFLGALGAGIGGNSTGGRFGEAVYKQASGGLSAQNAAQREENQNAFMQQALSAIAKRPTPSSYASFTAGGTTGAPSQQTNPSVLQDQAGQPTMASLDESLARMRRLSGIA